MARTSIGLDIGTRAVRLAEIQHGSGSPTLSRFGRILLPIGAVDRGEVIDSQAVAATVTALWKRLGLTGRAVHVGVANRRVVVRVIEMPALPTEDLASAIRYQAQEHIPIPLEEAVMDFEILEETTNAEGAALNRVLVVAAERATIAALLETVKIANLEAASVELNAYPLVRCFASATGNAEAIVDIGAGVTNVVVHQRGKITFTRILPTFGGDEFTNAIAAGLGVDRDTAEVLKRRASTVMRERSPVNAGSMRTAEAPARGRPTREGLRPRGFDVEGVRGAELPEEGEADIDEDVHATIGIIEPIVDRFVTEVRGSIDFYSGQPGAEQMDRVILTGGGALMGGIVEKLESAIGLQVDLGRPFDRVPIGRVEVSPQERSVAEPFMGVAIGLALAGVR